MPTSAARLASFALLATIAGARSTPAQVLVRAGGEFQVNTRTAGGETVPEVAKDADGDFVVVWHEVDGSGGGIFARRFNSAGTALGSDFQVNTYTLGAQNGADVAMGAGGDFVVVWHSTGQDSGTGLFSGVFAQRFGSSGNKIAVEFQVNTYTPGNQDYGQVAIAGNGNFVIAWTDEKDGSGYGIFAKRYDSAGAVLAEEFQINAYTQGSQGLSDVAAETNGDFVVAWSSGPHDGPTSYAVFARRFGSNGTALGPDFQVNTYTPGNQILPDLGMDNDGDFVIAWQSDQQDGYLNGIFARRFNSSGTAQATELQINLVTFASQRNAEVAMDGAGRFVVTWQSYYQDYPFSDGVFARRFDAAGTPLAAEFQVNTYTADNQKYPAVEIDDAGRFVIAWASHGQDGSGDGVFAQRFSSLAILDIDGNGATGALTDGLLVLRFLFGFTGTTLTGGAVDLTACTRCDAPAIEGYLHTLI